MKSIISSCSKHFTNLSVDFFFFFIIIEELVITHSKESGFMFSMEATDRSRFLNDQKVAEKLEELSEEKPAIVNSPFNMMAKQKCEFIYLFNDAFVC